MESYIPISFLNDFLFCPRSIYFHQLYGRTATHLYQTTSQIKGKIAHQTIDQGKYTTAKAVLQGLDVYSTHYGLCGRIDTLDTKKHLLTERKKRIKVIYDGYIYQLYAQFHCLTEMGYQVNKLKLYSMDDNKSYPIPLPSEDTDKQNTFEKLIEEIKSFNLYDDFSSTPNKCRACIYHNLCDCPTC